MKKVQVVFDPKLEIDVARLADRWNQTPDLSTVAQARVLTPEEKTLDVSYTYLSLLAQAALVLAGFAGKVLLDTSEDVLKEWLSPHIRRLLPNPKTPIKVNWIELPNQGGYLMVIEDNS